MRHGIDQSQLSSAEKRGGGGGKGEGGGRGEDAGGRRGGQGEPRRKKLPKTSSSLLRLLPRCSHSTSRYHSCGSSWCSVSGCCLTSTGLLDFLGDDFYHVPYSALSLVRFWIHAHVSVYVAVGGFLASPWHLTDTCSVSASPEAYRELDFWEITSWMFPHTARGLEFLHAVLEEVGHARRCATTGGCLLGSRRAVNCGASAVAVLGRGCAHRSARQASCPAVQGDSWRFLRFVHRQGVRGLRREFSSWKCGIFRTPSTWMLSARVAGAPRV